MYALDIFARTHTQNIHSCNEYNMHDIDSYMLFHILFEHIRMEIRRVNNMLT